MKLEVLPLKGETIMDVPIKVNVICKDGLAGESTALVINPVTDKLTHLVVKKHYHPHDQYIVPIKYIESTTPEEIRLSIPLEMFQKMDPFLATQFVQVDQPHGILGNSYYAMPYVVNEDKTVLIETEQIPAGEMALHLGTRVKATDGFVGKVDEFMIDPATSKITHLILKEGHLWASRDVSIPISGIERIGSDIVYLNMDKQHIGELPVLRPPKVEK